MAYYGERPWHGLGVELQGVATAAEMIKAAGLDWVVRLHPLRTVSGISVPNNFAVIREDRRTPLGVVGRMFQPVQNVQAFDFFDAIVGQGQAVYHTAGSLGVGEKVWVLAKLPGELMPVKGDRIEKFLLLTNGHDGGFALRALFTPVRVVCQNTLNLALGQVWDAKVNGNFEMKAKEGKEKEGVAIRHVGDMTSKMEEARRILGLATRYYDALGQTFQRLAGFKMSVRQVGAVLDGLFPIKETERTTRDSMVGNAGIQQKVRSFMEKGAGTEIAGVRGTAWGLYNAVTEFVDHDRVTTGKTDAEKAANRLESQWFGSGAKIKQHALDAVVAVLNG
jgi:phage/plasmid-like protein (TIGR03299 family)